MVKAIQDSLPPLSRLTFHASRASPLHLIPLPLSPLPSIRLDPDKNILLLKNPLLASRLLGHPPIHADLIIRLLNYLII